MEPYTKNTREDKAVKAEDGGAPVKGRKSATSEFKTRVVRGQPADRQFDIDFWQEQGDEAIFAAAWEMICMVEQSKHGRKPTFDRTVTKVIRNTEASGRSSDVEHLKLLRKLKGK
jgi:hypothetical protein